MNCDGKRVDVRPNWKERTGMPDSWEGVQLWKSGGPPAEAFRAVGLEGCAPLGPPNPANFNKTHVVGKQGNRSRIGIDHRHGQAARPQHFHETGDAQAVHAHLSDERESDQWEAAWRST
jgi:hypothetical protein